MSKRRLRIALNLIFIAGLLIALWPLGQTAYGLWNQRTLRAAWQEESRVPSPKSRVQASKSEVQNPKAKVQSPKLKTRPKPQDQNPKTKIQNPKSKIPKWPPTRLIIPDINLDVVVAQGWDEATLRRAPGHYPLSALPGQPGNCVIAGHRNVYGSWFYRVDELWTGSTIQLKTPSETFTYRVVGVYGVSETDTSVMRPPADPNSPPQLTLITCTIPRTSDRIIVLALLDEGDSPYGQ